MKKIMFNDRYGLTQAVIEGRKTMTRRIIIPQPDFLSDNFGWAKRNNGDVILPKYGASEIVAVAQSYNSFYDDTYNPVLFPAGAGWGNKMFVKAELMPHQININGIKCERLYDISEADCLKEGVRVEFVRNDVPRYYYLDFKRQIKVWFDTPREAFASLIDKVSGRGTWGQNPWVVVYEFELVK